MNGLIRLLILGAMIANLTSCVSRSVDDDLSLDIEDGAQLSYEGNESDEFAEDSVASGSSDSTEEFSDEFSDGAKSSDVATSEGGEFDESFAEPKGGSSDSDFADDEFDEAPSTNVAQADNNSTAMDDEFSDFDNESNVAAAPEAPAIEESEEVAQEEAPIPDIVVEEEEQQIAESQPDSTEVAGNNAFEDTEIDQQVQASIPSKITDLKFQSNDTGGTVVVQGDRPLAYKTRVNAEANQFVVEIENTNLPDRLKDL